MKPDLSDAQHQNDLLGDGGPSTTASEQPVDADPEKGQMSPPQEKHEEQVRAITGFKWFLFLSSTLTGIFVYAIDNTIVADIVPAITNRFGSVNELPWLSVGFMIGGVAMIMPYGKFYNLFNAKWVYIASFILFQASSALCGGAPNMSAEIVGRVFAGVGGNGMYLGLLTLISVNSTDKERPAWLSLSGLFWGIGTVLGPVVGGSFELYTWRWAFYINLLFAAILIPIYLFILPSFDPAPGASLSDRLAKYDFLGSILSIGAICCLIMGINFGGVLFAWKSGSTIALFVVCGVLFVLFAVQQIFTIATTKDDRVFPVQFVQQKEPVLLFIAGSSGGASIYFALYYIPIYFQFTRGDTAIEAAVRLLPFVIILSAMVLVNGFFMSKFGRYTPWYIVGSIMDLVGYVLMSKIDVNTSTSAIYGYEVLIALGAGSFVQASFAVIQTIVSRDEMSYGITFMLVAQLSGLTLGLSVAGAIFLNLAQAQLQELLPSVPSQQIQELVSGTSGSLFQTLAPDVRTKALAILVDALRTTFIGGYAAAAAALCCALLMNHKKSVLPQGTARGQSPREGSFQSTRLSGQNVGPQSNCETPVLLTPRSNPTKCQPRRLLIKSAVAKKHSPRPPRPQPQLYTELQAVLQAVIAKQTTKPTHHAMSRPIKTLTEAADLLQLSHLLSTNIQTVIQEWSKEQLPSATNDGASPSMLPSRKLYEAQRTLLAITGTLTELIAEPSLRILEVGCQYWESRALYIACERRIPDLLAGCCGGQGVGIMELSHKTGIEAGKLARLLRCLCSNHIFAEAAPDHFANNVISAVLVGNEPLRAYVLNFNLDLYAASEHLPKSLLDPIRGSSYRVDETAWQDALGTEKSRWDWLEEKVEPGMVGNGGAVYPSVPELPKALRESEGGLVSRPEHEIFNLSMLGGGRVHGAAHPYDFPWAELGTATVVDVGGGVGGFCVQLSHLYPSLSFVLQDRAPVLKIAETEVWPRESPEALRDGRITFMEHDFFMENPVKGAEVYWLRSILHDWSDTYCITILSHLAIAMASTSRILICDQVMTTTLADRSLPETPGDETTLSTIAPGPLPANYGYSVRFSHQRDLCMMAIINGIERTPAQFRDVVKSAGLRVARVWQCRSQVAILELRLADVRESVRDGEVNGHG